MIDPTVPAVLNVIFDRMHATFLKSRNIYERLTCLSRISFIQDGCVSWPHSTDMIDLPVRADVHVVYNILDVCFLDITADLIIPALLQTLFRYSF